MPVSTTKPTSALHPKLPSFWTAQIIIWGGFSLAFIPFKQLIYGSLSDALLITAYQLPLSLILSGLLHVFFHRTDAATRTFWHASLIVFVGCAVVSTIDLLVSMPLNHLIGARANLNVAEFGHYVFRGMVYLIWSLGYIFIKAQFALRQQAFQAAVAEEKLRLESLRYQLNPHFLANSLAIIADEIDQDPVVARAMITRLTLFYRATVRQNEPNSTATLGDELELLRAYLGLECLRLGSVLTVDYAVDESLLNQPLPPLLLLPLAERAVQVCRDNLPKAFRIQITAQPSERSRMLIEIAHTGRLHDTRPPVDAEGSDLLNLRARLERHYPGTHRFEKTQDSTRVRATLYLPVVSPA